MARLTPAEAAAAWGAMLDARPAPAPVAHPGHGCRCSPCWERDGRLEALAEARAEARGD